MNNSFDNVLIDSQEFNSQCSLIRNEIKEGKENILNLVEGLQPLLTSALHDQRVKGISILSTVLNDIPNGCIPANEIGILANFLCDRLRDHHEVLPAVIKALVIVVNTERLNEGTAKRILSVIFQHVPCQQQQQVDRYNIYCIFKRLHETNKQELKNMGLDLVYGIITAIDGERDPRNLLFLFEWLEVFLKDFELGHLSEEMFEVLSCYFPVDFRPSSDDAITRDALAQSLSKCLCASQKFGDFIIPLALEKLDSELSTAKMDSLEILSLISQRFPPALLLKYSTVIWAPIHKEILSTQDEELQSLALRTLTSFVRCVTSKLDTDVLSLLQSMILNVKGNATPDSKLFDASCKIIISMAASKISSEYIVGIMVPLWINLYNITSTVKYQVDILRVLSSLCVITVEVSDLTFDGNKHLESALGLLLMALTNTKDEITTESLKCFKAIASHLPTSHRIILFNHLKLILFSSVGRDQRTHVLHCFKEYAKFYPKEIESLIKSLKTNSNLILYLEAIGSILDLKQLWPLCVKELSTYALENSKETSRLPLNIFRTILEKQKNLGLEEYLVEKEDFVFKLIDWFLIHSKEFNVDVDSDTLDDISSILCRIIAKLNEENQTKVLLQTEKINLNPIEETFVIWYGVLIGLKNFQLLDMETWNRFIKTAISTKYSYINNVLSQLIGNLLNKLNDDVVLDKVLVEIERHISSECNLIQNVFNILCFIIKALVLRGHKSATIWMDKLLHLAAKYKEACKCFRIILDDTYVCFSKDCYVKERLLYRQRFFLDVINYMNTNYTSEDTNYLIVIAHLVQGVPESVLQMHLTKIMKWIILYLETSDDVIITCNLCKIINEMIQSKVADIFRFTDEILKVYLKLSTKNPCMKVRIETLKGIRLFTELPRHEIITRKEDIIKNLNVCVDDRKRLVRKEAMDTRLKWYLIDSPI